MKPLFEQLATLGLLCLTTFLSLVSSYDCSDIRASGLRFNLTELGSGTLNATKKTPPTETETVYKFNLCNPLTPNENEDDCKKGTYVCMIITNIKDGDRRVTEVKQIAAEVDDQPFEPDCTLGQRKEDQPAPLLINLEGGDEGQTANFTLICGEQSNPELKDYDGKVLQIQWKTKYACGTLVDPEEPEGYSIITKFLIIIVIFALTYFGVGAAYNYQVYGARGWDLLPNRDFWREIPYLIGDVFRYIMRFIQNGGRPGYSGL